MVIPAHRELCDISVVTDELAEQLNFACPDIGFVNTNN